MDLAGYKIVEIIPRKYKNSYIIRNVSTRFKYNNIFTSVINILTYLKLTVILFKIENFLDRCLGKRLSSRYFTLPQLLVFRLNDVDFPDIPKLL